MNCCTDAPVHSAADCRDVVKLPEVQDIRRYFLKLLIQRHWYVTETSDGEYIDLVSLGKN